MATFSAYCVEFVGVLAVLCTILYYYYVRVLVPYKHLPSFRFEHKVLYWIITRKPLNSIFFQFITDISKRYEDEGIFVMWFFKPYVFVFSEEATKLLINNPDAVDKPSEYQLLNFCLKDALFICNGQKWRRLRALISPAFQTSIIRNSIDIYNDYASKLVQQLKITKQQETLKYLKECFIRAFIESIYGFQADELEENGYNVYRMMEIVENLEKFAAQRFISPLLYWDSILHIFPSARKNLELYNESSVRGRKLLREANDRFIKRKHQDNATNYEFKSVAEVLLDQHDKDESFSLEDVLLQTNAFIATNSEAVSSIVMWCLFLLGHHADIQERLFEEVISMTGDKVDFTDIRHLTYMECVIKESVRLYTTFPMFARCLKKDVQCGKYKIPENSTVVLTPYLLHRNPSIYPNPEKFNPDRFMDPNSKINEWSYVPFAEGIRSCPGKNFAIMAMKVILCRVLRNFRVISLDRREDVVLSWRIVLTSTKNLRIKFVPRKSTSSESVA